jgi:ornithine decarboxylase
VQAVIAGKDQEWLELEAAACDYEARLLPPFFNTLTQYVEMDNSTFACPGHQHGAFFKKHPAGRQFYDFFGENVFRADMCNADVKLGDLLIHEGSAKHAQKFAAKVFNADKTYFVLNGTSAANKVVTNALLTRGDLVLFDRNNHKSNHHGALIQAGRRLSIWKLRAIRSALSAALTSAALMSITCGISSAKRRQRKPRPLARFVWR